MNMLDSDGHTYVSKASIAVELNHEVFYCETSRTVVCACTVVMQCGTNEAVLVTSRMCVSLLGLNC